MLHQLVFELESSQECGGLLSFKKMVKGCLNFFRGRKSEIIHRSSKKKLFVYFMIAASLEG